MKLTPDYIRDKMLWLGFSPSNKGFQYLIEAEIIIEENSNSAYNIIKQIYMPIAKKNECSWASVERCIRKAIDSAMIVMPEKIEDYLHFAPNDNGEALSYKNSDFLAAFHMALHRG